MERGFSSRLRENFKALRPERHGIKVEATPVERVLYEATGGVPVEVTHREFNSASGKELLPEKLTRKEIVFLPGTGLDVGTRTAQEIGESFVRSRGGGRTYMIRSKISKKIENPFKEENEAIKKFIEEKNLENFVLAGNSQGGDRAITLAAELGNKVRALVLIDSVGLYEQDPAEMTKQFFANVGIDTPKDLIANLVNKRGRDKALIIQRGLQSGADVMFGMINDIRNIRENNPEFIERIKGDAEALARVNPHLADVRCPVVLISGRKDPISDPRRIAPIAERRYNLEMHSPLGRELLGKDASSRAMVKNAASRNEYLQKEIFPNSPWVRMVVPKKLSGHPVQYFRTEDIANAALGLIERGEREARRGEEKLENSGPE